VSSANVELVRRHYENWNRGDTAGVIAAFSPDVEWHGRESGVEVQGGPDVQVMTIEADGIAYFAILAAAFEKLRGLPVKKTT
jgi:ketosteroid isomerase-like protein